MTRFGMPALDRPGLVRPALSLPLLAGLLLLTGCAGQQPGGPSGPNPDAPPMIGTPADGESEAIGLVNLWRVTGAEGETDPTWLRLDAGEFQLWRDCGMIMGSWRASDSLLIAAPFGGMGDCVTNTMPKVDWLESVTGFKISPDGYYLIDPSGATVASLSIDGAPEPIPTAAEFYAQPPELTDQVREYFHAAATLPAGLTPATDAALEGKWIPVAYAVSTDPHVLFEAGGTWTGSDGCNGGQGRWAVGEDGEFLATSGPSTLIACEGAPVPSWVGQAASAGINADGWLLLFDTAGNEVGRLERG
ncbi:META domain-containing protein [Leifsonella bigeumensis]